MEVGTSAGEGPVPPAPKTVTNSMRLRGAILDLLVEGGKVPIHLPLDKGWVVRVRCPLTMRPHSDLGVPRAPLVVVVTMVIWVIVRTIPPLNGNLGNSQGYPPPYAPYERQNHHYNNRGPFPYSRDLGHGVNSQYAYDTQYGYRPNYQNRYDTPFRHFNSNDSYERRDEVEYNVSTSNQFYPLRDLEGPYENPMSGAGLVNPPQCLKSSTSDNFASPGPSGQIQHWGFHKPPQGIKRPIDQKERPEEEENYELKRKKS